MYLRITTNDNTTYSNFIQDQYITDMGAGVHEIIKAKLKHGPVEYTLPNGEVINFNASEIKSITLEF